MKQREPKLYIEDILESIELIEEYLSKNTREEFISSKQLQDSVIRRLEIIGEAARNIPQQLIGFGREKHDDLADAFAYLILWIIENNKPEPGIIIIETNSIFDWNGFGGYKPLSLNTVF